MSSSLKHQASSINVAAGKPNVGSSEAEHTGRFEQVNHPRSQKRTKEVGDKEGRKLAAARIQKRRKREAETLRQLGLQQRPQSRLFIRDTARPPVSSLHQSPAHSLLDSTGNNIDSSKVCLLRGLVPEDVEHGEEIGELSGGEEEEAMVCSMLLCQF
jgi:hypothetical protein